MSYQMSKMIKNVCQFVFAVAVAVLMTCRIWRVGGVVTRREVNFQKISVCDESYGVPLGERAKVASFLTCTVLCLDVNSCESLTFNTDTKLCKCNGAPFLNPTTSGCAVRVQYARMEVPLIPVCRPGNGCTDPLNNVRLCNGGGPFVCDPSQGRVEVFHNGTWGTVCDDWWDNNRYRVNGIVTCKMLGYWTGVSFTKAKYGEGVGPILMDEVRCNGNVMSLFDCQFNGWKSSNCGHNEDVGVRCN